MQFAFSTSTLMVITLLASVALFANLGWYRLSRRHRALRTHFRTMDDLLKRKQVELIQNNEALAQALTTTQHRQATLDERNRRLQEVDDQKTKMFSVISHDLRGPLSTVIGLLDLLAQGHMTPEEQQEFIQKAANRVQNTYEMLTNLLYWSRQQMQGMEIRPQEINLETIANEVLGVFQPMGASKGVRVVRDIQEPVYVYSDPDMVNVVLRNLVSNAIKFTPPGGTVWIREVTLGDYVSIAVEDSGVGIDTQTLQRLFSSEGVSSPGTHQEKGTGLGLSLCREFVQLNGGKISVESTPNQGSTFRFTLPVAEQSVAAMV